VKWSPMWSRRGPPPVVDNRDHHLPQLSVFWAQPQRVPVLYPPYYRIPLLFCERRILGVRLSRRFRLSVDPVVQGVPVEAVMLGDML
jgi:hypothetical protein